MCLPDVSGIDDFQVLGQTEVSIQVGWKNPPAEVDYFRLTATDPSGQEEELSVQRSQEARTKHTILGQLCDTPNIIKIKNIRVCFKVTLMWCYSVIQYCGGADCFSFCVSLKCIFFAGLFPGTDYQISVQAVKGGMEGKPSSVTGGTGQSSPVSVLLCGPHSHVYIQRLIFKFRNRSQELKEVGSHLR